MRRQMPVASRTAVLTMGLAALPDVLQILPVLAWWGFGDGTFAAPVPIGDITIVPYALIVGDLNCYGTADFIVGDVTAPSTVYFNDGTGKNFTRVSFGDSKGTAFGSTVGDVDKDGRPDIAVARSEAPNVLYFASGPAGRCK